jgi:hypothetical protein
MTLTAFGHDGLPGGDLKEKACHSLRSFPGFFFCRGEKTIYLTYLSDIQYTFYYHILQKILIYYHYLDVYCYISYICSIVSDIHSFITTHEKN